MNKLFSKPNIKLAGDSAVFVDFCESIHHEINSKLHNFITGGRYDELTSNLGFKKVSAVGAAINTNLL